MSTLSSDIRVPGLAPALNTDLVSMLDALAAKRSRNLLRSAYYDGRNASFRGFSSSLTPPHMKRLELVLGWSAKAVDILNRRCRLDGFTDGGLDLPLTRIYSDNWLDSEASQANVSSLIHGVSFLVTSPGDTSKGEPPALITSRDALSGTGIWDGRSRRLRSFLAVDDYDDDGQPSRMVLHVANQLHDIVKLRSGWTLETRNHQYGMLVDPLVYKARLGRPFGYSRISRPIMSLHDQALRTLMRSEVTSELYQLPQRVLLGADESAFMDASGNMVPRWQAVLGAVWAVANDEDGNRPDVKQLPGAPQTPYLEQLRMQAQLFAGEAGIALASLGLQGDSNPTSADAYAASREDLVSEAEGTTDGWAPSWRRAMIRALAINEGMAVPPPEWETMITPKWRNPAYSSRAASADAGLKQLQAMPWLGETSVGMELLGLTEDQIKRATAERRRAEGRIMRRTLITAPPALPGPDTMTTEGPDGAIEA